MALSVIVYPGDGVRTQFNIPFALGYIKESDVTARVDGEVDGAGNQIYRTLVFLSPEIVEVQGPAVPVGTNIIFERTVVQDELIVDYEDGDVINEENMNTSQKQMIMLVHQVLDGRFAQFQSGFDMGGFVITGLGTPTNPNDAASKAYVDSVISDSAVNAAIAVAARDAAVAAQTAAAGSAATAIASSNIAVAAKDTAVSSAASASDDATATNADRLQTQADRAVTTADRVQTQADRVVTSADRVQTQSDRVQTGLDRTAAVSAAAASEVSKNFAQKWASENEDVVVNDGTNTGYSARHWANKAAVSAAAAQTFDPVLYTRRSGALITDEKTQGTNGGDAAIGWNNRVLTTERYDYDNLVIVASNSFTVAYDCVAHYVTAGYSSTGSNMKSRLWDNTVSAAVGPVGVNQYAKDTGINMHGCAVLTAGHNYVLQTYSSTAQATNGLGAPTNSGNECYTQIWLERI